MKNLFCFISSTFEDMQQERDNLKKIIIPTINEKIIRAGYNLECIDLRWGIDTSNMSVSESSKKVLTACFNEIKKSKPYLIVFIGEKYGWIPNAKDISEALYSYGLDSKKFNNKSVTQMEIEFAEEYYQDHSKLIFCFRKQINYDDNSIIEDKFVAKATEKEALDKLKRNIKEKYPNQCLEYSAVWDNENNCIRLEEKFNQKIIDKIIENLAIEENANNQNQYIITNNQFEAIIEKNVSFFEGRKKEIKAILNFIDNSKHKMLLIKGESGIGKSYLLSKVIKELEEKNFYVLKFFCGINSDTLTITNMIEYFSYQIDGKNIIGNNLNEKLTNYFKKINALATTNNVCIIIDAIDQLNSKTPILQFLNTFSYAKNIKIIVSSTIDYKNLKRLTYFDREELLLDKLTIEDAKQVFNKFFLGSKKENLINIENYLFFNNKNELVTSPIYLSLMIQKFNNLSSKDFNRIYQIKEENKVSFDQALEEYLISMINESNVSIETELDNFKKTIVKEIKHADIFFDTIAVSLNGVSSEEMEYIFKELGITYYPVDFANFLKYIINFVSEYSDGYWRFNHKFVQNHYKQKVLKTTSYQKYVSIMAKYFTKKQQLTGQIYYLIESKNYKELFELVTINYRNKKFYNSFTNFVTIDNCYEIFNSLQTYDKDNLCIRFLYRLIYGNYFSYEIAKKTSNIFIPLYCATDKALRAYRYNLNVTLAYSAYNHQKYKDVVRIISNIRKENEKFYSTEDFEYFEVEELKLLAEIKLGKVKMKQIHFDLECRDYYYINTNDLEKKKEYAKKYLSVINLFFEALSNTKYIAKYFSHSMFLRMVELIYNNIFEEEERLTIMADCCLYLSSRILTKYYLKTSKNRSDIYKNLMEEKEYINKFKNEIDKYLESDSGNLKLKARLAFNMSKYCDNYDNEDDYRYAKKAKEYYHLILSKRLNETNVKNYALALDCKVWNDEMIGQINNFDAKEMLKISKQLVYYFPSTSNYEMLEEAYNRCKRLKIFSNQDKIDQKKYIQEKKEKIKYEVSKEKMFKRSNLLIDMIAFSIFSLIYCLLYLLTPFAIKDRIVVDTIFKSLYIGIIFGILIGGFIKNLLQIILIKRYKIKYDIFKIIVLSILLIITIMILNYIISNTYVINDKMNIIDKIIIKLSLYGVYLFLTGFLIFMIKKGVTIKLYRYSSDIENYKNYVIRYKKILVNNFIGTGISLGVLLMFYNKHQELKKMINNILINTQYYWVINLYDILMILIVLFFMLITIYDFYLTMRHYNNSKKNSNDN